MKKFKKIVFGVILIIIIVNCICFNISLGADSGYTKDQFHTLDAPIPTEDSYEMHGAAGQVLYRNAYCIQAGASWWWELITYDVVCKVEFRGDECTFYKTGGGTWKAKNEICASLGAVLTPNTLIPDEILKNVNREDSFGHFDTFEAATAKRDGGDEMSLSNWGLWQCIEDWANECSYGEGDTPIFISDFEYAGADTPDGFEFYSASQKIAKLTELNLDVYILHNENFQDIMLVYPYGENLPGEVPEDPVIPEDPEPELTNITVIKKWEDEDNIDGLRPLNITVKLYADDVEYKKATFGETDNWTCQFTDLPTINEYGNYIEYTVEEIVPDGYQATMEYVYEE